MDRSARHVVCEAVVETSPRFLMRVNEEGADDTNDEKQDDGHCQHVFIRRHWYPLDLDSKFAPQKVKNLGL